jgi:hypothetical protein
MIADGDVSGNLYWLPVALLAAVPAILTWAWPVIAIVGLFAIANALFPSKGK